MKPTVRALLAFAVSLFRSRLSPQLEILALRHRLTVYHRSNTPVVRKNSVRTLLMLPIPLI